MEVIKDSIPGHRSQEKEATYTDVIKYVVKSILLCIRLNTNVTAVIR